MNQAGDTTEQKEIPLFHLFNIYIYLIVKLKQLTLIFSLSKKIKG